MKKLSIIFLVFLVFALAAASIYLFTTRTKCIKNNVIVNQPKSNQPSVNATSSNWKLPASSDQGYAYTGEDGTIYIYNLSKKTTLKTGNKTFFNVSGGSGLGRTEARLSPDLKYTAFIDTDKKTLNIMSNTTGEAATLPDTNEVTYVTGWTGDSSGVIYYVEEDNIFTRKSGPIGDSSFLTSPETFNIQKATKGFHVSYLNNGENVSLYPVLEVVGAWGNNLLTRSSEYNRKKIIAFDLKTFTADYRFVKDEFDDFATLQYTIDQEGKNWAYTNSKNPTTDAEVVYAKFPEKSGVVVDNGAWAEVQWPIISPDGTKLVYIKRSAMVEGNVDYDVWLYDAQTKTKSVLEKHAWPEHWVSNQDVVLKVNKFPPSAKTNYKLEVMNIGSKKADTIKEFSQ